MAAEELIEVKFRLPDVSDIGTCKYSSTTTVAYLKEKIITQWPNENGPKTRNDIKLINAGKILENNKTLAESRSPVSEIPGGVIIMHVAVRPPMADKNNENSQIPQKRADVRAQSCDPNNNSTQVYTSVDVSIWRLYRTSHELLNRAAARVAFRNSLGNQI